MSAPSTRSSVSSVRDALAAATDALTAAGCETPRLDAELLLADAMAIDRARLITDADAGVSPREARLAMGHVRRRVQREPVAYILGRKGFRRIELVVDRRVLIPRPETELLVEAALELMPDGARVHEVGTGSGAIALALADERPDLRITASDVSAPAIDLARANATRLGLDVGLSVARGLPPRTFDLVLANLPYIGAGEWATLQPEITRYEPRDAVVAGPNGLEAIASLVAAAAPATLLALEHATDQAAAVRGLLRDAETRRDLTGRERVTVGRVP